MTVTQWLVILGSAVFGLALAHFEAQRFFADIDRRLARIEKRLGME